MPYDPSLFTLAETRSNLTIEWYDSTRGLQSKTFRGIQFETIVFAKGYLSWEDDEGAIVAFAHHEPFTWTIEHELV